MQLKLFKIFVSVCSYFKMKGKNIFVLKTTTCKKLETTKTILTEK